MGEEQTMVRKTCPLQAIAGGRSWCIEGKCALWNEHIGRCGLIASGWLEADRLLAEERSRA